MKKTLALILTLVLCAGVLAACDSQPAETTAPAVQGTTAPAAESTTSPATEALEFSFEGKTLDVISGHDINDLPLDGFIQEAIGLDVKWTPRGTTEQIQAMMTDKVTPSLLYHWDITWGNEMGRYGAFVNLYDYYDIMPNFFARYEAYGEEIKADYEVAEGELYCAPIFLNGSAEHYAWMYREDIFQELNLETPTDWDSFLAVCEALKTAYPESYPFTCRSLNGDNLWALLEFGQQFGVDFQCNQPALDQTTGKFYNPYTTDAAREMVKMLRSLIDLGYMDIATLANDTAMWVADMSSGKSFITYDKAFQLDNIEKAGQEADPDFSLSWWNNIPLVESDLPYQCRAAKDYSLAWSITSKCADVELAVRYLDWMYSDEGSLILSWGKEGESYGIDENGNKYFLEGYDSTYQARYQESGYIDMNATVASYSEKCQEMIFDTMAVSAEGDFWDFPALTFNSEEQKVITSYQQDWLLTRARYYQNYLLGNLDINDDATWEQFKAEMFAYNETDILAAYDSAYARLMSK